MKRGKLDLAVMPQMEMGLTRVRKLPRRAPAAVRPTAATAAKRQATTAATAAKIPEKTPAKTSKESRASDSCFCGLLSQVLKPQKKETQGGGPSVSF